VFRQVSIRNHPSPCPGKLQPAADLPGYRLTDIDWDGAYEQQHADPRPRLNATPRKAGIRRGRGLTDCLASWLTVSPPPKTDPGPYQRQLGRLGAALTRIIFQDKTVRPKSAGALTRTIVFVQEPRRILDSMPESHQPAFNQLADTSITDQKLRSARDFASRSIPSRAAATLRRIGR